MTRHPPMTRKIDPITFEVVCNALSSIADEMALVVLRSAYSPVVRDAMDYSTAICDRHGQVVAQGLTLAVQLGSFPDVMEVLLREFRDDMAPGDIFICNDPYGSGGQHLPDLYVIKPLFVDGAVRGYAATMAQRVARVQYPDRKSSNCLQGCTICASCGCTGPCWTELTKRGNGSQSAGFPRGAHGPVEPRAGAVVEPPYPQIPEAGLP